MMTAMRISIGLAIIYFTWLGIRILDALEQGETHSELLKYITKKHRAMNKIKKGD